MFMMESSTNTIATTISGGIVSLHSGTKRKRDDSFPSRSDSSEEEPQLADSGASAEPGSEIDDEEEDADDDHVESWTEEQHEQFVEAIFNVGLRQSSPSVIMENMNLPRGAVNLTSERIKSKLQKYRNNKEKSKQEFMDEYQSFLQRAKLIGGCRLNNPSSLLHMMGPEERTLLGGDVAGYLTFATLKGDGANKSNKHNSNSEGGGEGTYDGTILSSNILQRGVIDFVSDFAGRPIPFPALSEAEKNSPLGASMTFVMGLFFSMQQQLVKNREARGESTKHLKMSPAMEAAAAAVTSVGMSSTTAAAIIDSTAHLVAPASSSSSNTVSPTIKTTTTIPMSESTATTTTTVTSGRVFGGKDFIVPSSAPQSQIYSALSTFLEREPSMNRSFGGPGDDRGVNDMH
ncbi:Myb-like DNA-binding protein [Nitzschia inconspicua]|uniref:Myb-like DNA-binding protein n=1 Tax=Nitzschia inconspicua TaxID=303405 RepID=A0A9K3PZW0_9STRA|nr:Myb-like DNA-binding protein [Nitzschia inconspicua]